MTFLDSNVWLYALWSITDPRHRLAIQRIAQPRLAVSTQVINEVCSNLQRKAGFPNDQIEQVVRYFYSVTTVLPVTRDSMIKACALRSRYSLSFWDSQLLSCALLAGCTTFESEDLDDGLIIEGALTVHNPLK